MTVNKHRPHIFVLPEDDANRQLANGFVLGVSHDRRIQILPEAGGWTNVRDKFLSEHVSGMRRYTERHIVLLLDFDDQIGRRGQIIQQIPEDLISRVFVIGAKSEPEALRKAGLGSFEDIGKSIAAECRAGGQGIWSHTELIDNTSEINRLEPIIRPLLF